ncbi:MAG: metallophosphoesterase, partial [Bacteroidia bacterium]|nr:metallophosphoesterase [Bacteroidia bacterium]
MNKKFLLPLLMTVALFLVSCDKDDDPIVTNPFDDQSESSDAARSKIVVISDLHMGNDLVYSENVKHLDRLEQFLKEVRASETIKELVLGGDILDEWYVPTRIDTYGSGTQADFVRKSVEANK